MTAGPVVGSTGAWVLATLLLAVAAVAPPGPPRARGEEDLVITRTFRVGGPADQRQRAIAVWPAERDGAERFPVLVAFHGLGEARKGPRVGYRAWVDDYNLVEAYRALLSPPLVPADFGGLVRDEHLALMNADLKRKAMAGLFVVGVYTPDLLSRRERKELSVGRYANWVADELLEDVHETFPVTDPRRESTGVDGVSLGGFVALRVGFARPDVFGVVGAIQPAIRGQVENIVERAATARAQAPQRIRLLSSDGDPYLPPTRALSSALRERQIPHVVRVVPGPHGYAFNRGPGAIDLLWNGDRALAGGRAP